MEHSIIAPSSAFIWGSPDGCTGWVLMSQQYPEIEESEDSRNGSASHEIGKTLINEMQQGIYGQSFKDFEDKKATNGILFDQDMFDCAKIYADDVSSVMRKTGIFAGLNIGVEQKIKCLSIHELSYGTPDTWVYDFNNHILYIWDYKFGHRVVEIFECYQLLNYLSGVLDHLNINGLVDQKITVRMRIIQPRGYHRDGIIREWKTKASNLRGYFNILHDKAHQALSSGATIHSGPHCRDCSARHSCPAAIESGLNLYEVAKQPIGIDMSNDALGLQLTIVKRALKQLEYIESGLSARVEGLIRKGQLIPGWLFESGKGREKWLKPDSEIIMLGKVLNHDLKKPEKAITPKQARDKGIDPALINQYSEKSKTALSLIQDDGNKAKRLFNRGNKQ